MSKLEDSDDAGYDLDTPIKQPTKYAETDNPKTIFNNQRLSNINNLKMRLKNVSSL